MGGGTEKSPQDAFCIFGLKEWLRQIDIFWGPFIFFFKVDTQWKVKETRNWPESQEQQVTVPSAEFGIEVCQIL